MLEQESITYYTLCIFRNIQKRKKLINLKENRNAIKYCVLLKHWCYIIEDVGAADWAPLLNILSRSKSVPLIITLRIIAAFLWVINNSNVILFREACWSHHDCEQVHDVMDVDCKNCANFKSFIFWALQLYLTHFFARLINIIVLEIVFIVD